MRRPTRTLAVGSFACLLALGTPARAHDPPVCFDVRWRADTRDPRTPLAGGTDGEAVCLANRGLVFLDAASGAWRLACNKAFGIPSTEVPDLGYAPDGRLLVATSGGLRSTSDGGCTWDLDPAFAGDNTTALAQDPTNAARFVLTTGGRIDAPDGVYESTDGGRAWTQRSTIAKDEFYEELLIAPSDPLRLYAAATAIDAASMTLTRFVARSNDGGMTWQRFDQMVASDAAGLRALAVHPVDADTLLSLAVASDRTLPDRVLLSTDAGSTFVEVLSAPRITNASFGEDGATAWITALGDAGGTGLWRSADRARTFEPIAGPYYMGCAFERAGNLYACGRWSAAEPFGGIGVSRNGQIAFEPLMRFDEVCDPVACAPASETTTACVDLWRDWQYEIHGCTGVYGGLMAPTGVSGPATTKSACGCPGGALAGPPDGGEAGANAQPTPSGSTGGATSVASEAPSDGACSASGPTRPRERFVRAWAIAALILATVRVATASRRDRGASSWSRRRPLPRC